MTLIEKINQDFLIAYKAKETEFVSVLRMLKSAITNKQIADKKELNDEDVVAVIKREIKQRKDSAAEYERAGRTDLSDKEMSEVKLLEKYLPTQLNDTELEAIVAQKVSETGAMGMKDMGKVIGAVMAVTKGSADGAKISEITKKLLLL
jgi:uncharacterized protein YqeY